MLYEFHLLEKEVDWSMNHQDESQIDLELSDYWSLSKNIEN